MLLCFTTFTCPHWSLEQTLHAAHAHGYHGLEVRCDARHEHGVEVIRSPEQRSRLREDFQMRGVEPVCLATSIQLLADHAVELLEGRLKLAADVGFKAVRVYTGQPDTPDQPITESIEQAGRQLEQAEKLARQYGVELWLETHGLAARAEQAVKICQQVESDHVGVLYDTLATARSGEMPDQTFIALGRHTRHVHFVDGQLDQAKLLISPLGHGQLPLDTIFTRLVEAGYEGYLCGHWFAEHDSQEPDEALKHFQHYVTRLAKRHDVEILPPMR